MSHIPLDNPSKGEDRSNWAVRMPRIPLPASLQNLSLVKLALIVVLALVASVAFAIGLLHTSLFAVKRIDVNGLSHLQRNDVVGLSKLQVGGPMISVDEAKAAAQIETNPWVESAYVRSAWPHVITIDVVERRPLAQAQTGDKKWATIGNNGVILSIAPAPATNLPALLEVISPSQPGSSLGVGTDSMIQVATIMPVSLAPHVKQIESKGGELRLGLDSGTIVELGNSDDIANKLTAAASVISHADPKTLAILDVRSPHLPVATPTAAARPATTPTTAKTAVKSSTTTTKANSPSTSTTSVKLKTTTTVGPTN